VAAGRQGWRGGGLAPAAATPMGAPAHAAASHVCCRPQENYFFDGPDRELNSRRVVLRVRFYDTDKKAVITLKVRAGSCPPASLPPCGHVPTWRLIRALLNRHSLRQGAPTPNAWDVAANAGCRASRSSRMALARPQRWNATPAPRRPARGCRTRQRCCSTHRSSFKAWQSEGVTT